MSLSTEGRLEIGKSGRKRSATIRSRGCAYSYLLEDRGRCHMIPVADPGAETRSRADEHVGSARVLGWAFSRDWALVFVSHQRIRILIPLSLCNLSTIIFVQRLGCMFSLFLKPHHARVSSRECFHERPLQATMVWEC